MDGGRVWYHSWSVRNMGHQVKMESDDGPSRFALSSSSPAVMMLAISLARMTGICCEASPLPLLPRLPQISVPRQKTAIGTCVTDKCRTRAERRELVQILQAVLFSSHTSRSFQLACLLSRNPPTIAATGTPPRPSRPRSVPRSPLCFQQWAQRAKRTQPWTLPSLWPQL